MKTNRVVSVAGAAVLISGIFLGLTLLSRAQEQSISSSAVLPTDQPDSVVRVVADSQGLLQVPPDQIPKFGTFWIVSGPQPPPPFPFLPPEYDPAVTPVFAIGPEGEFLVDGTGGAAPQPNTRQAMLGINTANLVCPNDQIMRLI